MDSLMLGRQYRPAFERDGFVLVRGFLSPRETDELQARFASFIEEVAPGVPSSDAFYEVKGDRGTLKYLPRLAKHDPYFAGLQTSERFQKFAEGLLNDAAVPQGIEWFNKCSRVGKATPPHQDGYYYMIEPNEGVHFWLALDAVDEENGCIRYVRGSHRRGLRPHRRSDTLGFSQVIEDFGDSDVALEEAMIMQPGDMLAHHTLTIHRAGPNPSERERRAMGLIYFAARAKVDADKRDAYHKKLMDELASAGKI